MSEQAFDGDFLFNVEPWRIQPSLQLEPAVAPSDSPLWTDNKAQFIMWYLRLFVLVTKHGTYIDGFAGPQEERDTESWAAKLVLASKPQWIKHFHLCDASKAQIARLEQLRLKQPLYDSRNRRLNRTVRLYYGDFNDTVDEILSNGRISQKQATFCLLDQRTFECRWETVEKLARYKKKENKIELFYFLANNWFERAIHAQKDTEVLARWWGRTDWTELKAMTREERRDVIVDRLKNELGHKSVKPWRIYNRDDGGATMYYMIHATDHPEAPALMSRAYRRVIHAEEPQEQLKLGFAGDSKGPGSEGSPPPVGSKRSA